MTPVPLHLFSGFIHASKAKRGVGGLCAIVLLLACPGRADPPAPSASAAPAPVTPRAELFPLTSVRLLAGPFAAAQQTDHTYLLELEPDRLLAWFRREAGLPPKAAVYPGWETSGTAGHTLGHYLSALSTMWQATGDERLRDRVNYIVDELAACQTANGNGYISAIPHGKEIFAQVAAGQLDAKSQFNFTNAWVPWYTMHKLFAGLIDAYERTGNAQARAVVVKLADWCGSVVGPLDDATMQRMLAIEHGGMAESLAEIGFITSEPKYLALAEKFRHAAVFDPLARGQDQLNGLHANTQIPKMIGYDRIYQLTGDPAYGAVARNFWNFVVHDRSFATGGHGTHERFFSPAKFRENMLSEIGPETCNTYNMLKLTERLFTDQPTGELMDYYERALYNHILASEMPGHPGELTYYTSMRPGAFHTFSQPFSNFWCCVGTGMENHARYGDIIYAHAGADKLLVNLFLPSELQWQGLTLRQETRYPADGQSQLRFTVLPEPRTLTVAVRYPGWAAPGGLKLSVNGERVAAATATVPGQYAEVRREWKQGDVLTVDLSLEIRTEPLPDTPGFAAIFYGPVLLAGDLGNDGLRDADFLSQTINEEKELPARQIPVLLASAADIPTHLTAVANEPLTFKLAGIVAPVADVTLRPAYALADRRYALYWRLTTSADYEKEAQALEESERHERELNAASFDHLIPGEQQLDADHNVQMENSSTGMSNERRYRDAWDGGWFSYAVKVPPDKPVSLLCTYWGGEGSPRQFDILVEGQKIASQHLHNDQPGKFFDVTYPVPAELTRGKDRVIVRFQAGPHTTAGGVFDFRVMPQ